MIRPQYGRLSVPGRIGIPVLIAGLFLLPHLLVGEEDPLVVSISPAVDGQFELRWNAVPGAAGYRVDWRSDLAAGEWRPAEPAAVWPITETSWAGTIPAGEGRRFYRVVAYSQAGTSRGALLSSATLGEWTAEELAAMLLEAGIPLPAAHGAKAIALTYATVDWDGVTPTVASGALILPRGEDPGPFPLLSYQHTTLIANQDAPSFGGGLEFLIGLAMSADGYVAVLPDYLGRGIAAGFHPYLHAASEATAVIDMLRASRLLCSAESVSLNSQLFLGGYSQGGHATMAAHHMMEENYPEEFPLTAVTPMAGPYSLSQVIFDLMISNEPYDNPAYMAFVLVVYNRIYEIFDSLTLALREPYGTEIPSLFDGNHTADEINALLPTVPAEMFRPEILAEIQAEVNHPLRVALRENDTYRWGPHAPVRLLHCEDDLTIPYENSVLATAYFTEHGEAEVSFFDPRTLPFLDGSHTGCAPWAFLRAREWFAEFRN